MRYGMTLALTGTLLLAGSASAQNVYGTLSNFDVFNDTGQDTHGFEIELHGVSSKDVTFTFGAPYIRYGKPDLVDFPGGVYVRYQSAYDPARQAFVERTPIPGAINPTAGHQCWTGGAPGYTSSGCEHFGLELLHSPTDTKYRWLIADPATAGALKPFGADVSIPAPIWTMAPAAAGAAPVMQADLHAPEGRPGAFGEAVWVKVYETESAERVELNHLLTDDPVVPQAVAQVEVEWELLQSNPKQPEKGVLHHGRPLGNGNQSVVRRYEFYKYTGAYDPESHEALCGGGGKRDSGCRTPGPGELGDYIGAQMAAAHVGAEAVPQVIVAGVVDGASAQRRIASGSWVSIFGSNLSPDTRAWRDSDFAGTSLPKTLDGVSVKINGKDAAICYISPGQLNVQAPDDDTAGTVEVQVTNSYGSGRGTATLQRFAPGFFTFPGSYVAAVHADGAYIAPAGAFGQAAAARPAKAGEVILLFGTGFGPTTPAAPAGRIQDKPARLDDSSQLIIRIGDVPVEVQYAGMISPGVYQFNVVLPDLSDGDHPVRAEIGGSSSQAGLTIPVHN